MSETNNKPVRMKRVVGYAPEDEHNRFKAALALRGVGMSQWILQAIRRYLAETDEEDRAKDAGRRGE